MISVPGVIKKPDGYYKSTYQESHELGRGAFGSVHQAYRKGEREPVAVKKQLKDTPEYRQKMKKWELLVTECEIADTIRHPYIVKMYDMFQDSEYVYLVQELCSGGTLEKYIEKRRPLPSHEVRRIFQQMLEGIDHLHHREILHRDIKAENILLDHSGNVKIGDFGVSKQGGNIVSTTMVGTLNHAAPEIMTADEYSYECDIFSAGCVLYHMVTGIIPNELPYDLRRNEGRIPPDAYDLIDNMVKEQRKRFTLQQCLNHPFMTNDPSNALSGLRINEDATNQRAQQGNGPVQKNYGGSPERQKGYGYGGEHRQSYTAGPTEKVAFDNSQDRRNVTYGGNPTNQNPHHGYSGRNENHKTDSGTPEYNRTSHICAVCHQQITSGKARKVGDQIWHESCLQCAACTALIPGELHIHQNEIFCKNCYARQFLPRCQSCNETITGRCVNFNGINLHEECFICTRCKTSLLNQNPHLENKRPYCITCHTDMFADRCAGCSRPITSSDSGLKFDNRIWHRNCFTCSNCRKSLADGVIQVGSRYLCVQCA